MRKSFTFVRFVEGSNTRLEALFFTRVRDAESIEDDGSSIRYIEKAFVVFRIESNNFGIPLVVYIRKEEDISDAMQPAFVKDCVHVYSVDRRHLAVCESTDFGRFYIVTPFMVSHSKHSKE